MIKVGNLITLCSGLNSTFLVVKGKDSWLPFQYSKNDGPLLVVAFRIIHNKALTKGMQRPFRVLALFQGKVCEFGFKNKKTFECCFKSVK